MDETDRRILGLLRGNARLPLKTIAAEVGLARSSARQRIARLEAEGVIRGYAARVDAGQAGQIGAMLSIRLRTTPDPQVVAAVTGRSEVARCWSLSGEVDLLVEAQADGTDQLNALRDWISGLDGVAGVSTALVLKRDKDG